MWAEPHSRDRSTHGIFALNIGGTRYNISESRWLPFARPVADNCTSLVSDPTLVKGFVSALNFVIMLINRRALQQKESAVQSYPITWSICEKVGLAFLTMDIY